VPNIFIWKINRDGRKPVLRVAEESVRFQNTPNRLLIILSEVSVTTERATQWCLIIWFDFLRVVFSAVQALVLDGSRCGLFTGLVIASMSVGWSALSLFLAIGMHADIYIPSDNEIFEPKLDVINSGFLGYYWLMLLHRCLDRLVSNPNVCDGLTRERLSAPSTSLFLGKIRIIRSDANRSSRKVCFSHTMPFYGSVNETRKRFSTAAITTKKGPNFALHPIDLEFYILVVDTPITNLKPGCSRLPSPHHLCGGK